MPRAPLFSGDLGRKEGNKTFTLKERKKVQPNPNWTGGGPCCERRGAGGVGVTGGQPYCILEPKVFNFKGGGRRRGVGFSKRHLNADMIIT